VGDAEGPGASWFVDRVVVLGQDRLGVAAGFDYPIGAEFVG
jgi:hypothetical protein